MFASNLGKEESHESGLGSLGRVRGGFGVRDPCGKEVKAYSKAFGRIMTWLLWVFVGGGRII